MIDRTLLDAEQVAARLHVTLDWWRHNRRRLQESFGFPLPIAGIGGRWDPLAIQAWLDAQLPAYAPRPSAANDAGAPADWSAELDRRLDAARGA